MRRGSTSWHRRLLAAAVIGSTLGGWGAPSLAAAGEPVVTVLPSLTTVRPGLATPTLGGSRRTVDERAAARLLAARNEVESFQVAVDAPAGGVSAVRVAAGTTPSQGAGQDALAFPAANVIVYREGNVVIPPAERSDGEITDRASPDLWPDVLVPEIDPYHGIDRNAFPADVADGARVVAWVDVLVPVTIDGAPTPAGTYAGTIVVTGTLPGGPWSETVDIEVTVLPITLPSTPSLATAFGNSVGPDAMCVAHGLAACGGTEAGWQMAARYARAALANRMSPFVPSWAPVSANQRTWFDAYLRPLILGTAGTDTALPGARIDRVGIYFSTFANCGTSCIAAWKAAATAPSGAFAERVFFYLCDEPGGSSVAWSACMGSPTASLAKKDAAWPELPDLVTASIDQVDAQAATCGYAGAGTTCRAVIDILTPLVNRIDDNPSGGFPCCIGDQRASYDGWLAAGGGPANELWLYTSNASFGSNGPGDAAWDHPYWNGWPGYAIDQPASEHRAMGLVAFLERASGELYWGTMERLAAIGCSQAVDDGTDACTWTGTYDSGGSGDGTLFYPGKPAFIGGPAGSDIPLESIRLKRIRDGREDYEWLRFLSLHGQDALARTVAAGLVPHPYQADVPPASADCGASPRAYSCARATLADAILGVLGTPVDVSLAGLSASVPSVTAGEVSVVSVTAENVDAEPANGVAITLQVPAASTVLGLSAGCSTSGTTLVAGRGTGGLVTCSIGTLGSGASASRSVTLGAWRAGTFALTARVWSTTVDPDPADDALSVAGSAAYASPQSTPCTRLGTAGADALTGGSGADVLCGFTGNDILAGGGGNDVLIGGPGADRASYSGARGPVSASLANREARCRGTSSCGQGRDRFGSIEDLHGGAYGDSLVGSSGVNRIWGGGGKDTVSGGASGDELWGGGGSDVLYGRDGPDRIHGGTGNDTIVGGAGRDTCWQDAGSGRVSC